MRLSLSQLNGTGKVGESFYHLHVILQSLLCWLYGKVLSCKMFNDSGMVINTSSKKKLGREYRLANVLPYEKGDII